MEKSFESNQAIDTIQLGEKIGVLLEVSDVILLTGDLSAGKTTITKGIGKSLGVTKIINSPTFTIVKEYHGRISLYHLDLYRLEGLNQDYDLEEYINGDGVCVIEWPYQIEEILPKEYLEIHLERIDEFNRKITVKAYGPHYEEIVKRL
ncbi:MAG: tRNA (adenosine(37)-N6)-threonylcarbamoyltransferase complex ATPase subunit type 1 TsaE [Anaeroplasmataceae bacterium]|nr:tRNA (adenosine(37)-N6)-threonylcarbamoyltransferase complex ATPase subunit type 1 TsaE [Anaeroplasmataceae bacterium]